MTWRSATRGEAGAALIAALLALGLVSAIGIGMAIIASTESAVAANTAAAEAAGYAAEAGMAIVAAELEDVADWSVVLAGGVLSAALRDGRVTLGLPDGRVIDLARHTSALNCGRSDGCTNGQLDEPTADRPWGLNNPRWRVYGHATTADLWGEGPDLPLFHIVAWVGDDPSEEDGAPELDGAAEGGPPAAGSGIMRVRTESFGARGAHAARIGTILRLPGASAARVVIRSTGR